MRSKGQASRARLIAAAGVLGLLVGAVVTVVAVGTGAVMCTSDLEGECVALARTLALRAGFVAGIATVVMLLLVAGLLRMVLMDEARRTEARREALWE